MYLGKHASHCTGIYCAHHPTRITADEPTSSYPFVEGPLVTATKLNERVTEPSRYSAELPESESAESGITGSGVLLAGTDPGLLSIRADPRTLPGFCD